MSHVFPVNAVRNTHTSKIHTSHTPITGNRPCKQSVRLRNCSFFYYISKLKNVIITDFFLKLYSSGSEYSESDDESDLGDDSDLEKKEVSKDKEKVSSDFTNDCGKELWKHNDNSGTCCTTITWNSNSGIKEDT